MVKVRKELRNKMEEIVNQYTKYYQSDLQKDLEIIENLNHVTKWLWIVMEYGTQLINFQDSLDCILFTYWVKQGYNNIYEINIIKNTIRKLSQKEIEDLL